MRVRARAVILVSGRLVVCRERRMGKAHISLPGGRVNDREGVTDALVREVAEETGLAVSVGGLLYVAEAVASFRRHDLNLVFLADPVGDAPSEHELDLVDLGERPLPQIMPPILDRIAADVAGDWPPAAPRWLGNIWRAPREA